MMIYSPGCGKKLRSIYILMEYICVPYYDSIYYR